MGDEVGSQQRTDHRPGDAADKLARRARHQNDRHKGEHGGEGGAQQWQPEVADGFQCGGTHGHAVAALILHPIRHDDGVVHHDPERHHQTGDRHLVNGQIDQVHAGERERHGKRQRQGHDNGGLDSQGHQQHCHYDEEALHNVEQQGIEPLIGITLLIEAGDEADIIRQVLLQLGQHCIDPCRPEVDAVILCHPQADHHGPFTIGKGQLTLRLVQGTSYLGQIAKAQGLALLAGTQRDLADPLQGIEGAADLHLKAIVAALQLSGGYFGIGTAQRLGKLFATHAAGTEGEGIEPHLDLLLWCPDPLDVFGARQLASPAFQLGAVAGEAIQLRLARPAPDHIDQPGEGVALLVIQLGGTGAGWQSGGKICQPVTNSGPDRLDIADLILELQIDDGETGARARLDQLDLALGPQPVLDGLAHQRFHPFGAGPGEVGNHAGKTAGELGIFGSGQGLQCRKGGRQQQCDRQQQQAAILDKRADHDCGSGCAT